MKTSTEPVPSLVPMPPPAVFLPALLTPAPKAAKRVLEFFTAQINNDHTRKAYAARRFAEWCDKRKIGELPAVHPVHVAAFVKELQQKFSPPTLKQHLAALCMLFDWLVTGHLLDVNPAHAVRGPKYVVNKGKTPVSTAEEARELLDCIKLVRNTGGRKDGREDEESDLVGRPDHVDRRHGLQLCPHQCRDPDEGSGLFRPGAPRLGPLA